MPSKQEYDQAFYAEWEIAMAFPTDAKVDAYRHAAEARRRIVRRKTALRLEISNLWKRRFAEIKIQNDTLEQALEQSYKEAHADINANLADVLVRLQR